MKTQTIQVHICIPINVTGKPTKETLREYVLDFLGGSVLGTAEDYSIDLDGTKATIVKIGV